MLKPELTIELANLVVRTYIIVSLRGFYFLFMTNRLFGTNGFHVKAENERFTASSSHCYQSLKYANFMSLFGRLRQQIAPKNVPPVIFLNSTNEIIDLWCYQSRSRRRFLNSVI